MSSAIVDQCNALARSWAWWLGLSLVDAAIVLAVVSLVWLGIRRKASPQLGYLLFLLVPLKLFVPIHVGVPEHLVSWLPWAAAERVAEDHATAVIPSAEAVEGAFADVPGPSASRNAADGLAAPRADDFQAAFPPVATNHSSLSLGAWLLALWLCGIVSLLMRLVLAQVRFQRTVLRGAKAVDPAQLPVDFAGLLARVGLRRGLRVVESERIASPVIWGVLRPTLILPCGITGSLSGEQLQWVLLHELAHVRRRDLAVNCFQRAAAILHFLNPSIWIANRAIDRLREYACDDLASALASVSQVESGEAFLGVMRYAAAVEQRREGRLEGALGMFESTVRAACFQRMKRLLDANRRVSVKLRWGSICLLLAVAALALPQIRAANRQPGQENKIATAEDGKTTPTATSGQRFELVVLGPDGKPVPKAEVEIRGDILPAAEQVERGQVTRKSNYGVFVRTDGRGFLVLNLVKKPNHFFVRVEHPGHGPFWADWSSREHPDPVPAKLTIELDAGWSVGGVIVDEQGKPIEGVKVHPVINFKKCAGDTRRLGTATVVTTDAQGRWRFDCVPVSMPDVWVEINHPEFMPNRRRLARSEFGIGQGAQPTARITMQRGLAVSGRVTDEAGKPIAGALVRTKFYNDIREARTDAGGQYRLVGCEPMMARIVASAKGRATDMMEVRIGPDMGPVDFQMKPGGRVRIRVLDEKGNPVARARIFFQRWRGMFFQRFEFDHVSQYADKDGVWQWNEAPLDEFQADICSPAGVQLTYQRLTAREEEYVFHMHAPLVISGSVVDSETKKPIPSFRVVPGVRSSDATVRWARAESYRATNGRYRTCPGRDAYAHLVRIEADGYRVAVSRDIKSDEGEVHVDFALVKAPDIRPTLLTPEGKPAAGAKVALEIAVSQTRVKNGEMDDYLTSAARCDADQAGRFHFPVEDGPYRLVVTHPSGYAVVTSSEQQTPTTITLTAWAKVEGTLRVGSRLAANVLLTINARKERGDLSGVRDIFGSYYATTGADGRFLFERVFPGAGWIGRDLGLMVNQGAAEVTSSVTIPAHFPAGKTTHLDIGGSGRPVIGKLAPPAGYGEKVLWNFALVHVGLAPPKPRPSPSTIHDSKQLRAWFEAWEKTTEGIAWQKAFDAHQKAIQTSPHFTATVARDGMFRFDDVPAGEYALRAHFSEHSAGYLPECGFTVPPITAEQRDQPLNLGVLTLQPTPGKNEPAPPPPLPAPPSTKP